MCVSEKWGTDVEAAVGLALDELKLTIDEVDVTVLEEPSRGFFGIGSKLALVRVEKKKPAPAPEKVLPKKEEKFERAEKKEAVKPEPKETWEPKESREPRESKAEPARAPKTERQASPKKAFSVAITATEDMETVEDHAALEFLKEVTEQMGLDIEITAKANEESVFVNIQGKDSGTIIGKRGQTLDAIQYLTSLVVNKEQEKYVRVVVDAENYRSKREKTLEKLASRIADKVVRTRKSVRLEPMNPYERKVIHATLQNNPRVTTRSEGQDPYRRVIVELK